MGGAKEVTRLIDYRLVLICPEIDRLVGPGWLSSLRTLPVESDATGGVLSADRFTA